MFKALVGTVLATVSVSCAQKKSSEVYQNSIKSVFTVYFTDLETNQLRGSCTGFFITNDGLGITSGPIVKAFRGTSASIKLPNGQELPCKLSFYPSVPGLGFIQTSNFASHKLILSQDHVKEGQDLYILALKDTQSYFSDVLVTDTNHNWIEFRENTLMNTPVIRTTGLVPKESFGAPLIDEEGNAVAVVANVENGFAIGYSVHYLKEIYASQEQSGFYATWEKIRNSIVDKILGAVG